MQHTCDKTDKMAGLDQNIVNGGPELLDIIDFSMDKVYKDYPVKMFQRSFTNERVKAKKCLFEDIDINLYEKEARMITFFTNVERIHPWIKTLDLFYYDHMGNNDKFDIKWYDVPTTWSDPNNNNNSIVIEILDKEQALQFNITFFVTTGTIRVQGSKYMTFVHSHFPVLTQILAKVIDNATHATVEGTV
ncbi:unnamed protein product [Mytilus coruscus]|uniref:Uncharacterized protein n=1 Tax=Mytilus coruscus TaxID=42192 RepID=A0A6J8C701_MYTCO|nr:unnamed protein product [Mytilus coruscus]